MTPTETLISRAASFFRTPLVWVLPEACAALRQPSPVAAVHNFRPEVLALQRMGIAAAPAWPDAQAGCVALSLPRQAEWACGLLAEALMRLSEGGTLLAVARNDRGGKRYAALLEEHFGLVWSDSKNHCRLAAVERPKELPAVVAEWKRSYVLRPVAGSGLLTLPGTFSSDRLDKGSALLAKHLPKLAGRVADFGAGWGYLSHHILSSAPDVSRLDLFEADDNALAAARTNLATFAAKTGFFWHDLLSEKVPQAYDAIVMNPPFHDLMDADPAIGKRFITAAAQALRPGGGLWMVANKHLPYEEVLEEEFGSWRSIAVEDGFKVLAATR